MTISDLIRDLKRLPSDCEVAVLATSGFARPPILVRVNQFAWADGAMGCGFSHPENAYLLRPANEII